MVWPQKIAPIKKLYTNNVSLRILTDDPMHTTNGNACRVPGDLNVTSGINILFFFIPDFRDLSRHLWLVQGPRKGFKREREGGIKPISCHCT